MRRHNSSPGFVGQKQKWFLLRMLSDDEQVQMDHSEAPEFDHWRWVSYWYPVGQVVEFKRDVYRRALKELAPHLMSHVSDRLSVRPAVPVTEHGNPRAER